MRRTKHTIKIHMWQLCNSRRKCKKYSCTPAAGKHSRSRQVSRTIAVWLALVCGQKTWFILTSCICSVFAKNRTPSKPLWPENAPRQRRCVHSLRPIARTTQIRWPQAEKFSWNRRAQWNSSPWSLRCVCSMAIVNKLLSWVLVNNPSSKPTKKIAYGNKKNDVGEVTKHRYPHRTAWLPRSPANGSPSLVPTTSESNRGKCNERNK